MRVARIRRGRGGAAKEQLSSYQGYSRAKRWINERRASCSSRVGFSGNRAMTVWRYFHVARPSSALRNRGQESVFHLLPLVLSIGTALLDRLISQLRHHHCSFQCILLDGDPRRGFRIVRNVPGGSDGGTRGSLRADKEEKDEAYRDRGADGNAPCDLPIRHGGSNS